MSDDPAPQEPTPIPRRGSWLPRVLVESLLIVLSVLLALAVDEWREERGQVERAQIAARSIRAELEENRGNVERARSNHLAMLDSLERYAAVDRVPPARIYLAGIFNPALVHSTAWDSARETGATSEMPYELVLGLSRIYDRQQRYRDLGDGLVEDLMADIRREGTRSVLRDRFRGFIALQEDFANREAALVEEYGRALADLDAHRF